MTTLNVLMLESNPDDALLLQRELRRAGYIPQMTVVQTEPDFIAQLDVSIDIILSDLHLPSYSAEKALAELKRRGLDVPFILISGGMSEETGVGFVSKGAADYLLKDRLSRLGAAIKKALDDRAGRDERSRTARALAVSEQRFRHMFEVLPDVILFIDARDGTILDANPAVALLGYKPVDLAGKNWSMLFPENRYPNSDDVRTVAARGDTVVMTQFFNHRDGTNIVMDLMVTQLEYTEHGHRLLVNLRDATERMRADAERATAAQLNNQFEREKLLNEQRQRFINFAAHEFKNPMTAIRSSNAMLQEYGDHMSEAARRKHHEQIEAQIQKMLDLISDMLTVGRLNEGETALNLQTMDLANFTRAMVEEIRSIYPRYPITINISKGDYSLRADPKLLHQIVGNLLTNAVRYSPERRPITVTLAASGDSLTLSVSDKGIGIYEHDIPTLFDPFKRGSNVGSINGTGLGLSIVRQSVELHGGSIEVHSTPDKGSTFIVRMPAAPTTAPIT